MDGGMQRVGSRGGELGMIEGRRRSGAWRRAGMRWEDGRNNEAMKRGKRFGILRRLDELPAARPSSPRGKKRQI